MSGWWVNKPSAPPLKGIQEWLLYFRNSVMTTISTLLDLHPLDRLQINDKREIQEIRSWQHRYGNIQELPWFFFQRELSDGRLELRNPGGYAVAVDPVDVCDIVRGEPVIVRAMPRKVFLDRLNLSIKDRQVQPSMDCYAEAYVLYVTKNRWGQIDAFVWFKDESLNDERPIRASVHDDDRRMLSAKSRRTLMPILGGSNAANYSADFGLQHDMDYSRNVVKRFVSASLNSNNEVIDVLASAGIRKIPRSELNRMCRQI